MREDPPGPLLLQEHCVHGPLALFLQGGRQRWGFSAPLVPAPPSPSGGADILERWGLSSPDSVPLG